MQEVWEASGQKGSALLLLLAISDHAHDDGAGAYPSVETLARKVRMTPRNTQMLIKKLEAAGELEVMRGAGPSGCNLYWVKSLQGVKTRVVRGEKQRGEGVKPASPRTVMEPSEPSPRKERGPAPSKTVAPEVFPITDQMRAFVAKDAPGIDVQRETEKFLDHHRSKGSVFIDWSAAWKNWIRRAVEFGVQQKGGTNASRNSQHQERSGRNGAQGSASIARGGPVPKPVPAVGSDTGLSSLREPALAGD